MKKILLCMVAFFAAMVGNAATCTLAGGFNGWSTDATPMTENNGVWSVTVPQLINEFKVVYDGSWLGATNGQKLTLGEPLTLGDGANITFADASINAIDNALVEFNATTKQLTVTGSVGEATVTYAIHGSFANGTDWVTTDMTEANGTWSVTFTGLNNASGSFGIKQLTAGNQSAWIACPEGADYDVISGPVTNLVCADANTVNFTVDGLTGNFDFIFNADAKTLTIKEAGGEPVTPSETCCLAGGFNGWSTDATPMTLADGLWTVTVAQLTNEFKVVYNGSWLGSDSRLTLGEALLLSAAEQGNVTFADEAITVIDNALVTFNPASSELTVTGTIGEATVSYALHGNFATGEWMTSDMTATGSVWSVTFQALENATGEFGIKELTAGAQSAWYSCPAEADYLTITGPVTNLACATADNANFIVEGLTGNFEFAFDAEAKTLTVKEAQMDGIESVDADAAAPAMWFTLSGVRVAEPTAAGLYLRKQGRQVTKVIVK
nr:hypothetical protein [Bacteroides sp.]